MKLELPLWLRTKLHSFRGRDVQRQIRSLDFAIAAGENLKRLTNANSFIIFESNLGSTYVTSEDWKSYIEWSRDCESFLGFMFDTKKHQSKFAGLGPIRFVTSIPNKLTSVRNRDFEKEINLKIEYLEKIQEEIKRDAKPSKWERIFQWLDRNIVTVAVSTAVSTAVSSGVVYFLLTHGVRTGQ